MRRIVLHRRAVKYLRSMPRERQAKIVEALEENSPDGSAFALAFTAPSSNLVGMTLRKSSMSITVVPRAMHTKAPGPKRSLDMGQTAGGAGDRHQM